MTLTTRIADFDCFCGADCGGWIKEGTPYAKISAGGSWPTVYLHPGCVDDFKAKLVRKLKPAQNVPRPAPVLVERECQRCGADYAGQAGDVVDRCRGCDGPLVDLDADDREAEVTTVECAECEWPMRVRDTSSRGREPPPGSAPRTSATGRCAPTAPTGSRRRRHPAHQVRPSRQRRAAVEAPAELAVLAQVGCTRPARSRPWTASNPPPPNLPPHATRDPSR
jgi:hypothetical protein